MDRVSPLKQPTSARKESIGRFLIRAAALALLSVAPICIAYWTWFIITQSLPLRWNQTTTTTTTAPGRLSSYLVPYRSIPALVLHYTSFLEIAFFVWFHKRRDEYSRKVPLQPFSSTSQARKAEALAYAEYRKRHTASGLTPEDRANLFKLCMETITTDVRKWLEGWFSSDGRTSVKFNDIKRDNMVDWLAWAFFCTYAEDLTQEELTEVQGMLGQAEKLFNVKFAEGRNLNARPLRLNLDPLRAEHRPLLWYFIVFIVNIGHCVLLRIFGFRHDEIVCESPLQKRLLDTRLEDQPTVTFWYHPGSVDVENAWVAKEWAGKCNGVEAESKTDIKKQSTEDAIKHLKSDETTREPIVFVHGIGAGLFIYFRLIRDLLSLGRPLFLVEIPYVSMQLVSTVPTVEETVNAMREMLSTHGFRSATWLGHSLGSVICTWMLKREPELVAGLCLIDPVCFLLHHPEIASSFVYRSPITKRQLLLSYFVAKELHIAHYIQRHFHWHQNILFPSQDKFPKDRTVVFLGETDDLVPSEDVRSYLKKHGNLPAQNLVWMDDCPHAGFLVRPGLMEKFVKAVAKCARISA